MQKRPAPRKRGVVISPPRVSAPPPPPPRKRKVKQSNWSNDEYNSESNIAPVPFASAAPLVNLDIQSVLNRRNLNREIESVLTLNLPFPNYAAVERFAKARLAARRRGQANRNALRAAEKRAKNVKVVQRVAGRLLARRATRPRLIIWSGIATLAKPKLKELFISRLVSPVNEISVIQGRSTVVARHTKNYGIKTFLKGADYRVDSLLFKGPSFAVRVFRNGKMTFTGGYPPGSTSLRTAPLSIIRKIFGTVSSFELKSCVAQFDSGMRVMADMETVGLAITKIVGRSKVSFPLPELDMRTQPFSSVGPIKIWPNGQVQISKFTTKTGMNDVYGLALRVIRSLKADGLLGPRGMTSRNTAPKKNKNVTTTCPKNKRPVPYSFGGTPPAGYYVGANPQGLPCCYKIPKKIGYMRPKIIQRFRELGVRIPESTRRAFGIDASNANLPVNVSGKEPNTHMTVVGDAVYLDMKRAPKDVLKRAAAKLGVSESDLVNELKTKQFPDDLLLSRLSVVPNLKIGTRMANRWPLPKLVNIAQRIGLVDITPSSSKLNIIRALVNRSGRLNRNNTGPYRINKRVASSYTKAGIIKKARQMYGINVSGEPTLKNMIAKIKAHANKVQFNTLYNSIIPENQGRRFKAAARENLMGKSKGEIRNRLKEMKKLITEAQGR